MIDDPKRRWRNLFGHFNHTQGLIIAVTVYGVMFILLRDVFSSTFAPVAHNVMISSIDGMTLVYVPDGEFTMGSETGEEDEKPAHVVYLDGFWIDRYEVTNAMYAKCIEEGECESTIVVFRLDLVPSFVESEEMGAAYVEYVKSNSVFANQPVTYTSPRNANSYCSWAGRRLPTEAEWEKAARGTDGRIYPWGEGISCEYANYYSCLGQLQVIGQYSKGVSPYGVYDMAGNAAEWVSDAYSSLYYKTSPYKNPQSSDIGKSRVFRGGSWADLGWVARSTNRPNPATYPNNEYIGFRCALTP